MSSALRPCPFCGSKNVSAETPYGCGMVLVECGDCQAKGPWYPIRRKVGGKVWASDAAKRAWNGDVLPIGDSP